MSIVAPSYSEGSEQPSYTHEHHEMDLLEKPARLDPNGPTWDVGCPDKSLLAVATLAPRAGEDASSSIGIWRRVRPDGSRDVMVSALGQDERGQAVAVGGRVLPLNEQLVIGRETMNFGEPFPDTVSRRHLAVGYSQEGGIIVSDLASSGGTKLERPLPEAKSVGNTVLRPALGGQAVELTLPRVASPEGTESKSAAKIRLRVFESINFDPDYQPLLIEHTKELERLSQRRTEVLQNHNEEFEEAKIHEAYERAVKKEKERFEVAIKPHLAKRLSLFEGDTDLGVVSAQHFATSIDRDGKVTDREGNPISSEPPRLGFITLPERFYDWSGAGHHKKKNEITGKVTTSSEHIVDLAASMLAGTWQGGREPLPIEIERDFAAETDWKYRYNAKPPRIYKAIRGFHRIAAQRLLYGAKGHAGGFLKIKDY